MQFFKRQLPVIIAFLAGMVFWAQYYIPSKLSQHVLETFNASWAIIMAGAAFILGVLSSLDHNWYKISQRKSGYGYSAVAIFFFGAVLLAGWFPAEPHALIRAFPNLMLSWQGLAAAILLALGVILLAAYAGQARKGRDAAFPTLAAGICLGALGLYGLLVVQPLSSGYILFWQVGHPAFSASTIKANSFFMWFFDNWFVPLDATMFSLLAFYIASAAFRAFRARSMEATALLIAGCLVMIGRVSLGEQIAVHIGNFSLNVTDIQSWIMNNPNTSAQRGILMGVILSQIAISLRIIFGIERTYMGGGD